MNSRVLGYQEALGFFSSPPQRPGALTLSLSHPGFSGLKKLGGKLQWRAALKRVGDRGKFLVKPSTPSGSAGSLKPSHQDRMCWTQGKTPPGGCVTPLDLRHASSGDCLPWAFLTSPPPFMAPFALELSFPPSHGTSPADPSFQGQDGHTSHILVPSPHSFFLFSF